MFELYSLTLALTGVYKLIGCSTIRVPREFHSSLKYSCTTHWSIRAQPMACALQIHTFMEIALLFHTSLYRHLVQEGLYTLPHAILISSHTFHPCEYLHSNSPHFVVHTIRYISSSFHGYTLVDSSAIYGAHFERTPHAFSFLAHFIPYKAHHTFESWQSILLC